MYNKAMGNMFTERQNEAACFILWGQLWIKPKQEEIRCFVITLLCRFALIPYCSPSFFGNAPVSVEH